METSKNNHQSDKQTNAEQSKLDAIWNKTIKCINDVSAICYKYPNCIHCPLARFNDYACMRSAYAHLKGMQAATTSKETYLEIDAVIRQHFPNLKVYESK